ncbi:putative bifunctional diguanylate cyclase/phosphodiesterase [Lysobacter koreensis]|uniref:Bifunctional diguanylate cyclase/phosphodiesterase n=1 Tax=Lysobacter koreensis TaxID=266122 RepID=A0ABW2YN06_9GAMM
MSPLFTLRKAQRAGDTDTSAERYTHALVRLTREVWHPDCTFDRAVGLICEVAAEALQVERVNAWRYDPQRRCLQCTHAYTRSDDRHAHPEELETLSLDGNDYAVTLEEVRAIDASDVESDPSTAHSVGALRHYLRRYNICALLDAPVRIEGQLLGVICHESVDSPRQWTREEFAFAGSMGDYVAMAHEIARRQRAEDEVQHLRLHDATTNLPNRDYMVELIRQRLAAPHPLARPAAVVHVRINAAHGTAMSASAPTLEDVMAQVAPRLRELVSDQPASNPLSLARARADAFAFVVARGASQADVVRLAERCVIAVQTLPRQHEEIEPVAAVGIAFAEVDESDARVLMRKAEQAADYAREQGRHAVEVFDIDHHQELVERLRRERALRAAFANNHFELHYQPERELGGGWSGAEALLRWRTDDGLVVAAEFIATLEASDLILPVGRWVLGQACVDAAQWPHCGNAPPMLRVNVSAHQFDGAGLAGDVAAALASSGLPPGRLCLEITETTLMHDIDRTLAVLQELKALGVRIAIDDFGTGYSSLVYLKRFPIDTLKIDRSFVQDLPHDRTDAAIVAAVVGLAEALGVEVVAEGIERLEQQHALQALGVERLQGWLYAPAMAQAQLRELFAAAPG